MENKQINNPSRSELITDFVKSNPQYYIKEFQKIGSKPSFSFSFNLYAAILGPIWFGMRNIWNWALAFLIIETFSVVQIIRGLFGNITKDAVQKIEQVQSTIAFRNKQLEAAITNNPDKVDVYKRNIKSLEDAMQGYIDEVARIEASAIWITIFGILLLISIKIVQGIMANSVLEKRYSEWLSDKTISPGMKTKNFISSIIFSSVIMFFSVVHYSFPGFLTIMDDFPTHPDIRLTSIKWVETIFDYAVLKGDALFTAITIGIRSVLDFLELLFVQTPWVVIITTIVVLTALSAGIRTAIYSAGFLAYMGFLGFWVKAMTTLALLGTAAILKVNPLDPKQESPFANSSLPSPPASCLKYTLVTTLLLFLTTLDISPLAAPATSSTILPTSIVPRDSSTLLTSNIMLSVSTFVVQVYCLNLPH